MNSVALLLAAFACVSAVEFKPIREWNYLNFTWPSEESLADAKMNGKYIPANNILSGIIYHGGYYYMSLPRMRASGVPATLVRIPVESEEQSPLLEPYPSWEMNMKYNCGAMQNVQNLEVDSNGRLWIIDIGRTATITNKPISKCPPKLVIHDLTTNETVMSYEFPDEVANHEGNYIYDLVVDESGGGWAYLTDNSRLDPGIIVFSLERKESWKIRHGASMWAQKDAVNLTIDGVLIKVPINLAGIALGPTHKNIQGREVFYSPLSSYHLYSINTVELQQPKYSLTDFQGRVKDYGKRPSQSDTMIMDNDDNLYYGLLNANSIAKWHVDNSFKNNQELMAQGPSHFFQWPKAFTFDDSGNLILLTTHTHKFFRKVMHLEDINFKILMANIGTNSYIHADSSSENNVYFHPMVADATESQPSSGGRLRPLLVFLIFAAMILC